MQEIIPFIGVPCFIIFCYSIYRIIKEKKKNNFLSKTFIIIAVVSFAITGLLVQLSEDKEEKKETVVNKSEVKDTKNRDVSDTNDKKKMTDEEKLIRTYVNDYNMTEPLAMSFIEQCKNIKIDIDSIEITKNNSDTQGTVGLIFSANGLNFVANGENYTVSNINHGDIIFLDNGNVVLTIPEVTVSDDQRISLISNAQLLVETVLKSPQSAEFASIGSWEVGRLRNQFSVTAYVDADNSFGSSLRNEFTITYTWDGNTDYNPQATGFIFNGETIF